MWSLILRLVTDPLLLLLAAVPGFLAVRLAAPQAGRIETTAAAFPLGAGLFSFILFLLSWAGLPLRLTTMAVVYTAILLPLLLLLAMRRRSMRSAAVVAHEAPHEQQSRKLARWGTWSLIALFTLVAAAISLGRSYTPFDASAIWASKGYGIALEGTVFAARLWGAHNLSYPLNIPLLISAFQLADGDLLPGSKLIFPLFYGSILLGAAGFWRRLGMSYVWVCAGILFLGTLPEIFRHATYGYINLPASAYLVLGTMWGVAGLAKGSRGQLAVAGLLLALGSWTRVEGIVYALVVAGALVVSWWFLRPGPFLIWWVLVPIAAIGGTWLVFYRIYAAGSSQAGSALVAALAGWRSGDLRLHSIRLIFGYFRRELLHTRTWGLLFPVTIAFLALHARRLFDRSFPEVFSLALATLGCGIVTAGLFYIGSYDRGDLVGWLTRGFPRAFFPAAILLAILGFVVAAVSGRPQSTQAVSSE